MKLTISSSFSILSFHNTTRAGPKVTISQHIEVHLNWKLW